MISWDDWKPRTSETGQRVDGQDELRGVLMTGTTVAWKIVVYKGGTFENIGINISRGEEYSGDEQNFSRVLKGQAPMMSDNEVKAAVVEYMREILKMIIDRAVRESDALP